MKAEKELEVVTLMTRLYCRKKHKCKDGLCPVCEELLQYVKIRRGKCPWGDEKPFCSNCPIHCYKRDMRERIKAVMRFSGPRMMLYHPIVAVRHLRETLRQKKRIESEAKKNV